MEKKINRVLRLFLSLSDGLWHLSSAQLAEMQAYSLMKEGPFSSGGILTIHRKNKVQLGDSMARQGIFKHSALRALASASLSVRKQSCNLGDSVGLCRLEMLGRGACYPLCEWMGLLERWASCCQHSKTGLGSQNAFSLCQVSRSSLNHTSLSRECGSPSVTLRASSELPGVTASLFLTKYLAHRSLNTCLGVFMPLLFQKQNKCSIQEETEKETPQTLRVLVTKISQATKYSSGKTQNP